MTLRTCSLRRSTGERRKENLNDFIIFLQEHEENCGILEDDPINFRKAIESSSPNQWIDVMNEEYKSIQDNKVWKLIPLLECVRPIECKWISKTKRDLRCNVERYKAHVVAKDFTQKEGINLKKIKISSL